MPLIELLLLACLLAMVIGLWLRVDALQQQVLHLQTRLTEHVRHELGAPVVMSSMIVPPSRPVAPTGTEPRVAALRLVKR